MKTGTETVAVSKLKSQLSKYLRKVGRGQEIIVTSFSHPVARLVPPGGAEPLLARRAVRPLRDLAAIKGFRVPAKADPVALLLEDRERR
ncbi:type II toxin-antitoxin system prevent-host-death family antitoxin [bacterium]|nr:type II toxin-antitoxin system prevent-host-death family antitoxin [bacterium]